MRFLADGPIRRGIIKLKLFHPSPPICSCHWKFHSVAVRRHQGRWLPPIDRRCRQAKSALRKARDRDHTPPSVLVSCRIRPPGELLALAPARHARPRCLLDKGGTYHRDEP